LRISILYLVVVLHKHSSPQKIEPDLACRDSTTTYMIVCSVIIVGDTLGESRSPLGTNSCELIRIFLIKSWMAYKLLLRGDTKKNVNAVAYWEHSIWGWLSFGTAVFQKKLGEKRFIFTLKKIFRLIFIYLVLALESISGVKR
jgi:hypothetical protein